MDENVGRIMLFRRKCNMFCLTIPKPSKDETFCFSECRWYRKTLRLKGNYLDFLWKIPCLTLPKKGVREAFSASKYFWHRESLWIRSGEGGECHRFPSIFLSHIVEKFRSGTLLCFKFLQATQNFIHKRGISRSSVDLLSHSAQKFRNGTL